MQSVGIFQIVALMFTSIEPPQKRWKNSINSPFIIFLVQQVNDMIGAAQFIRIGNWYTETLTSRRSLTNFVDNFRNFRGGFSAEREKQMINELDMYT